MSELIEIIFPAETEEGSQSQIGRWLKQTGEKVEIHEPVVEVQTDKVVIEVAAPASGIIDKILMIEGQAVQPGQALGTLRPSASSNRETETAQSPPRPRGPGLAQRPRLSPAVRRLLKKHDLDPETVMGSGRDGRITYQDVQRHLKERPLTSPPPSSPPSTAASGSSGSRLRPLTPMRRALAQNLAQSWRQAPQATGVFEADFSAVQSHRARQRAELEAAGIPLTYTAYLIRAATRAATKVPEVNSRWTEEGIELFSDINIGVAVALDKEGLVVPVLHRAQDLDLRTTAERLDQLTRSAHQGRLQRQELEEGTLTLTNHGVGGSLIAAPILYPPQAAILGVGKIEKRLRVESDDGVDSIRIRPLAYVTLTIDHRVLDGSTANLFLSHFVRTLQEWR